MRFSRSGRRLRALPFRALGALMALVLLAVLAVAGWSRVGMMDAEPAAWESVLEDPSIAVEEADDAIVLRPSTADPSGTGLVLLPGAKVAPEAYAARLSALVSELGLTVVIAEPPLRLAVLDRRDLDAYTRAAPEIGSWLVGGHSLGGVRACQLAEQADGLVLLASYCATDLSATDLPVLSLSGSEDGLSTPEKIAEHRDLLPDGATMVEIAGASHASFGDYGTQDGDGAPTLEDDEMDAAVEDAVAGLLRSLP